MGIPFSAPTPMGEDNEATHIIAHAGKLARNVRHIAIQTTELQHMVKLGLMALYFVLAAPIIEPITSPNYFLPALLFRTLCLSWDFVSSQLIMLRWSLAATWRRNDFGGMCL
jgi:hypothetical protein